MKVMKRLEEGLPLPQWIFFKDPDASFVLLELCNISCHFWLSMDKNPPLAPHI